MMFYTEIRDGLCAGWELSGHNIEMLWIRDERSSVQAYRLFNDGKKATLHGKAAGSIYFDEWSRPDLAQVREWLPQFWKLYDQIRTQYWEHMKEMMRPTRRENTYAAGRLDALPHEQKGPRWR